MLRDIYLFLLTLAVGVVWITSPELSINSLEVADRSVVGLEFPSRFSCDGCTIGRSFLATNNNENQYVFIAPISVPLNHLPNTTGGPEEWIHYHSGGLDGRNEPNLVFNYGDLVVFRDGGIGIYIRNGHPTALDEKQSMIYVFGESLWWAYKLDGIMRTVQLGSAPADRFPLDQDQQTQY